MATLSGNTIASTYLGLLNVSGAVGATTLESVTDGAGTATSLSLSQQKAKILLGTDSGDDFTINDGSNDILLIEGDTKDVTVLDDFILISDSSVIKMGAGADATFTHDGTTGLTIAATPISINSTGNLVLDSTIDIILDAAGGTFEFRDAGTTQLTIDVDGTAGDIDINLNVDGDDLVFNQYDGTEVMRMADSAYVGINEGSPSYRLDVTESRDASYCARFTNSQASADANGLIIAAGKATSVDTDGDCVWALLQDGDGTGIATMQYKHSGVTAEFVSTSDERLKENIKDTSVDGLSAINSLNFREFNWIENSNRGQTKIPIGLIAQEVESAGDKCSITKQFLKEQELKNGTKIENVRGIGYDGILLYLAKAVQELSAKVTALENA